MKAMIRGIFTTALTKLFLGYDYDIVQPSEEIAERLGLEVLEEDPDLTIHNRLDLQGVVARGTTNNLEAQRNIIGKEINDVVLRRKVGGSCMDIEFPWDSKKKLDEYRRTVFPTVQKHHYYKATILSLETLKRFILRFAELAERQSRDERVPKRRDELSLIAENCRRISGETPETFYQALQMTYFLQLVLQIESNGHSQSQGRMDQYLYPFYHRDKAAGKIEEGFVMELLENTWLNRTRSAFCKTPIPSPMVQGRPSLA